LSIQRIWEAKEEEKTCKNQDSVCKTRAKDMQKTVHTGIHKIRRKTSFISTKEMKTFRRTA
jgi:hypothetical protein